MIEFSCPGCLSQCVANGAFSGMNARCVVCGAFIVIPARSGETALLSGPLPSARAALPPARGPGGPGAPGRGRPPKPSVRPRTDGELVVLSERDDADESDPETVDLAGEDHEPSAGDRAGSFEDDGDAAEQEGAGDGDENEPRAPARKPKRNATELDGKLSWEDFPPDEEAEAAEPPGMSPANRKLLIYGGSVLAAVVIVLIVVLSGGEKQKPNVDEIVSQSTERKPEGPKPTGPPPKTEAKTPAKTLPPPAKDPDIPGPRELGPPVQRLTFATMVRNRNDNPAAWDAFARGKLYAVRGTVARVANGAVYLGDSPTDPGIACFPLPQSLKNPEVGLPVAFERLRPGQPVEVSGWYSGDLKLVACRVVAATIPAEEDYRDKDIELVGTVGTVDAASAERRPSVVFETFLTDCPITVRCMFRDSQREKLTNLKPGQPVSIRGHCEGRTFGVVEVHNCEIAYGGEPTTVGVARVTVERFIAAYEGDLLKAPRPDPKAPPVALLAADQLAAVFGVNTSQAIVAYRDKALAVTGRVAERLPGSRTIILEAGTKDKLRVELVFTADQYARLDPDRTTLTCRGVCAGSTDKFVRLENCELYDPSADASRRITEDYYPLDTTRVTVYDELVPGPFGASAHPLRRVAVRYEDPDLIKTIPLRLGSFPRATFEGESATQPKWIKDFTVANPKQKVVPELVQVRITYGQVETRARPPAPQLPEDWWDPILKIGAVKDETWNSTMPDGRTVTYKVVDFKRDSAGRTTVEISRTLRPPKNGAEAPKTGPEAPKTGPQNVWEETTLFYTRGVGEVRRVVTLRAANPGGTTGGRVTFERRIVEGDALGPPDPKKPSEPKK